MTCACTAAMKVALPSEKMNQQEPAIPKSNKAYNKSESIQIVLHGFDRLDMLEGESPW